ncbi:MAG: phage tail length tape measure family protein [Actinomycetota bacterium]|nr:phage tail length tape measure family protein [Actinomycetota bacterium]
MARELQILVTARNMAGGVLRGVRGDIDGIDGAARRASSNVGRNVGIAVAAVGAGLAVQVHSGINSLVELEEANAQTRAAIESTGGVAGITADEIRDMSEAFERQTTIDDKLIQSGANVLLTFRRVGERAFEPAMEAALNLSTRMGGDLNGAILQVGKALEDPVRGLTALRRAGIQFTEAQEDQIKAMVEANDLAGAQTLILAELETQFGGSARALSEGAGGAQRRWGDAVEDMQMHLATGFLPLIERASEKMGDLAADPAFIQGIEDFGGAMAGAFESALDFAEDIPWAQVGEALGVAGTGARMAMDAFLSAPPWLQTAILTGWGLNKLTGGGLGSIVGALGSGLIKGVLGMNAGVVNINAATVNGPGGGMPGAAGRGGGLVGGLARGAAVGTALAAVPLAGVAAVEVINFETMRSEQRTGLQGILNEMPRGTERINDSIAALESEINQERPLLDGILFNTNVRPQLERQLTELRNVKAAQDRTASDARSADAAMLTSSQTRTAQQATAIQVARETRDADRAMLGAAAFQTGLLTSIRDKAPMPPKVDVHVTNNVSVHEFQRTVTTSVRAAAPMGWTAV